MLGLLKRNKKPTQCGAFVARTGKQCEKNVPWGLTGYCWWHIPKKSIALVAVLSALCGFIAKTGGGWLAGKLYQSAEVKATHRTGATILQHQDVLAELTSELRYLNVILILRDDASAKLQVGQRLLVSLSEDYSLPSPREIEVLIEVTHLGSGPNEARLGAFCFSRSRVRGSNDFRQSIGYNTVAWHRPIAELPVPLAIGPNDPSPISLVRDLKNFHVQVLLPEALASSVDGIEIVANSSMGLERRLRLFSRKVQAQNWEEMDYDVKRRFWGRGNTATERVCFIRDAKEDLR